MLDLKSISKDLQDAARSVLEAKKPLHPNQQKIDVHEPEKDEITAKDFEHLRAGKKAKTVKEELSDELFEARYTYDDTKSPDAEITSGYGDLNHKKIHSNLISRGVPSDHASAISAHLKAGSHKSSTKLKQGAMTKHGKLTVHSKSDADTGKTKFIVEQIVNENTVDASCDELLISSPIVVELKEAYTFGDYLTAAKSIVGEEQAIELANYAYNKQDTNLFVEQVTRSDIESKLTTHRAAGHQVSEPKYTTKDGKLHAEYVVTDKESGIRRKYIHHGTARKVENMGTKGKRDEE